MKRHLLVAGVAMTAALLLSGCIGGSANTLESKSIDLSNGSSVADVGNTVSEDMSFLQVGCDCIEVSLKLPDGSNVGGMFESVVAENAEDGTIGVVRLRKEATGNPLVWQKSIQEFSSFWGGESTSALLSAYDMRASISETTMYEGETVFAGEEREGVRSTLTIVNTNEGGTKETIMAVEWIIEVV